MLNNKSILITGGTGSFGQKFVKTVLSLYNPKRLVVFSRDEFKQYEMQCRFSPVDYPCLRYFLGDIRDPDRLHRAFANIDVIIHAATLHDVPACEYNPYEAVKTNIIGSQNIVEAAIDRNVPKVIAISTEEAANPVSLFGATKLCSDRLFVSGNSYAGSGGTRFSVARFGNFIGCQGDLPGRFLKASLSGKVRIADPEMTRFFMPVQKAVEFTVSSLEVMNGGEIFIPKSPSMSVGGMLDALCPDAEVEVKGLSLGEEKHCVMIPGSEAANTYEYDDRYVIQPVYRYFERAEVGGSGQKVAQGFEYVSNKNGYRISKEELCRLAEVRGKC
ncbi:polysaccharide biosynthesis protein [Maridesulfovibrio sp.]|uniref:polysaccharide biosynthesis protein n=1 Tax=Maridesulfovibrio sp. TaxID=2795000 RepID=UPI002AA8B881|nr:polysaccharide biosynthesis protein [Maridesulfovibrio sp.]